LAGSSARFPARARSARRGNGPRVGPYEALVRQGGEFNLDPGRSRVGPQLPRQEACRGDLDRVRCARFLSHGFVLSRSRSFPDRRAVRVVRVRMVSAPERRESGPGTAAGPESLLARSIATLLVIVHRFVSPCNGRNETILLSNRAVGT